MSRIKLGGLIAATGLVAMISACQHTYGGVDVGRAPTSVVSPGPAYALRFSDDGANAKLTWATARDGAEGDVSLMLECEHASGIVHLTSVAPPETTSSLTLASDTLSARIDAQREVFDGHALMIGETTTQAPPLSGFRRSGRLTVGVEGKQGFVQLTPGPWQASVAKFFRVCERRLG